MFKNFKNKSNPAIYYDNKNFISYGDLLNFSNLIKEKIKENSLVIFLTNNSVESLMFYYSLINHDVCVLLLDSKIDQNNLDKFIKKYNPKYILIDNENKKNIKKYYINEQINNFLIYESLEKKIKYDLNHNLKLLITTSGTLGDPKCVKVSKKNLESNTNSIIEYLDLTENDKTITTLPPSYSYGLSVLNTHFYVGGSIISNNFSLYQKKFWELLHKNKITNINGVPFFYEILNKIGLKRIKGLKFLTQAGGNLDDKLFKDIVNYLEKTKMDLFLMYGQTEASPRISYCKINRNNSKIFTRPSIGKVISGGKIFLKDKSGRYIKKPFKNGEIIYQGPNVFCGYAKNFKDLAKIEKNKKLSTGDIAYYDQDNNYFIFGRKNRIAKLYGVRYDLNEIEKNIKRLSGKFTICLNIKNKIIILSEKKLDIKKITDVPLNCLIFKKLDNFPRLLSGKVDMVKLNTIIENEYK